MRDFCEHKEYVGNYSDKVTTLFCFCYNFTVLRTTQMDLGLKIIKVFFRIQEGHPQRDTEAAGAAKIQFFSFLIKDYAKHSC